MSDSTTAVNRVRTLLMNRGREGYGYDFPGEEFIAAGYHRRSLPPVLTRAHQVLFGSAPDRLFINFRMRQLMTLLHSTEMADFVLQPDSRVTYLPFDTAPFFEQAFIPEIVQLGHSNLLYLTGTLEANEGLGQAQQTWRVEATSPGLARITVQQPRATTYEINYALTGGLSVPIALPGSDFSIRFHSVPNGTAWRITAAGRPKTDLGDLYRRLLTSLGDAGVSQIFQPAVEPILTYQKVWREHPYFAYRFSALLLGLAAQVEVSPQAA
jgi:hypothetical protein